MRLCGISIRKYRDRISMPPANIFLIAVEGIQGSGVLVWFTLLARVPWGNIRNVWRYLAAAVRKWRQA